MTTARKTRIPEVIDAIVAAFDGATDAQVIDGPPQSTEDDYVLVDYTGELGPSGQVAYRYSVGGQADETFDVACQLSVEGGDRDFSELRRRAFTIFDALVAALLVDPTLGKLCERAVIQNASREPGEGSQLSYTLHFSVVCEGTRNRVR